MIEIRGRYYPDEYKEYAGCRNCKHQPEPLRMCEWGEKREIVELICSGWESKGADGTKERLGMIEIEYSKIEFAEEMKLLRSLLNQKNIPWEDLSSTGSCPCYRTHFKYKGFTWSVIHGYGTYGGYNPFQKIDHGLLEVMSKAVFNGEPQGWFKAEQIIELMEGV